MTRDLSLFHDESHRGRMRRAIDRDTARDGVRPPRGDVRPGRSTSRQRVGCRRGWASFGNAHPRGRGRTYLTTVKEVASVCVIPSIVTRSLTT